MTGRAAIFALAPFVALSGLIAPAALAEPEGDPAIAAGTEAVAAVDRAPTPPRPAISIQRPVGSVTISRAGDDLGAVRYARRSENEGFAVVGFSRSRGGKAASLPTGFVGMPTSSPLARAFRTSSFGYRRDPMTGRSKWHSGVDLAAPTGTPIMATQDGVVGTAGWKGGYGIAVVLNHGGGVQTLYAHMSRLTVSPGQAVRAGEVIGLVGSTGRSTGPHLHYEIRQNGRPVRPVVQ